MPERLTLVDCDIALARYPPSLQFHRALQTPPSPISHTTPNLVTFRFFVSALTHIRSRMSGCLDTDIIPSMFLHI